MASFTVFRPQALNAIYTSLTEAAAARHTYDNNPPSDRFFKDRVEAHFSLFCGEPKWDPEEQQQPPNDWRKSALENAFKAAMFGVVEKYIENSDELLTTLFDCLDLSLMCAEAAFLDALVPITLIEELLDLQTIEACERIFGYVESRQDRLTSGMVSGKGKGLILLRLCNELLRRLSKTKNTVFSGRILMFMANSFPLGERSGVNLKGEFNTENTTLYDDEMELDGENETLTEDEKRFYKTFWSLQRMFANPPLCFQEKAFEELQKSIDFTLIAFATITANETQMAGSKSHPSSSSASSSSAAVAVVSGAHDEEQRTRKRKHRSNEGLTEREAQDVKHEIFFPKFLTSKDLLRLEMADPYFRRHILVQFLIILQYLLGSSSREREPPQAGKPGPAKPTHVLAEPQEAWVNEAHKRIVDELKLTPPDGKRFADTVLMVLKRDKNWIHWKAESCQSFEETPLAENAYEDFPAKRRQLEAPYAAYRYKLGTHELTRLWTKANDVLPLAGKPGAGMPKIEDYIQNLRERPVAESLPEDERKEMHGARIWRALRIASAQHLHLFRELLDRAPLAEDEGQTCDRLASLVERDRLGPAARTGVANGEGKEKGDEGEGKIEDGDGEGENENEVEAEAEAEGQEGNGGGGDGGVAELARETRRENGETKKENGEVMMMDIEAEAETEAETGVRTGVRTEGRADTRMRNDSEEEDDEVHLVRNGGGESEVETPSGA